MFVITTGTKKSNRLQSAAEQNPECQTKQLKNKVEHLFSNTTETESQQAETSLWLLVVNSTDFQAPEEILQSDKKRSDVTVTSDSAEDFDPRTMLAQSRLNYIRNIWNAALKH